MQETEEMVKKPMPMMPIPEVPKETKAEKEERLLREKSRRDKIAIEVIQPIMERIYDVAFNCIETYKADSETPIKIPFAVNEGLIEALDETIEYLEGRASFAAGASIIGFALGRDGEAPARRYKSMAVITSALRELISAKAEQIQEEASSMRAHRQRSEMADLLGF